MRKFRSFTEKAELPPEAPGFHCTCSRVWPFPFSAPAASGPQHLLPSHDPGADAPGEQIESPHMARHLSVLLWQEHDAGLTKGPACIQGPLFHSAPLLLGPPKVQGSRLLIQVTYPRSQWATSQLDMCVSHSGFLPLCISEPARSLGSMCICVCVCVSVCVCTHTPLLWPGSHVPFSPPSAICLEARSASEMPSLC